jgi:hypothetical protein
LLITTTHLFVKFEDARKSCVIFFSLTLFSFSFMTLLWQLITYINENSFFLSWSYLS